MKHGLIWLGSIALAFAMAAMPQTPSGQNGTKKPAAKAKKATDESVERGKTLFEKKCAVCHYANSDAKKIGPGLQGLNKRGTFSVNGNKVTDDSLKTWIENGSSIMPPFKDVLTAEEIHDLVRYVRTL